MTFAIEDARRSFFFLDANGNRGVLIDSVGAGWSMVVAPGRRRGLRGRQAARRRARQLDDPL
mgnify:CR=1 FL=1